MSELKVQRTDKRVRWVCPHCQKGNVYRRTRLGSYRCQDCGEVFDEKIMKENVKKPMSVKDVKAQACDREKPSCPHCNSANFYSRSRLGGYRCRRCGGTFDEFDMRVIKSIEETARIRREKKRAYSLIWNKTNRVRIKAEKEIKQ
jgi:ribosomal protein L37AE/L43A